MTRLLTTATLCAFLGACGSTSNGRLPPMPSPLGQAKQLPVVGVGVSPVRALAEHRVALVEANLNLELTRKWYEDLSKDISPKGE